MQTKKLLFALILCHIFTTTLLANEKDTLAKTDFTEAELEAAYYASLDSIEAAIIYQTGAITLPGDFAQVNIPEGFRYVNVADTKTILFDVWGNLPYGEDVNPLGMLVPKDFAVNKEITYAIEMTFAKDGYVKDDDAKNIDYDDLLKDMQASTKKSNQQMRELGYPAAELVGWASPPYYDAENKKLLNLIKCFTQCIINIFN